MSRLKPKVKMYIEVKPGQDEKVKKVSYPTLDIEIRIGERTLKIRSVPAKDLDAVKTFFKLHEINIKEIPGVRRASYMQIRGHKITKIGKNELAIPVRGANLDEVLMEVQNVEKELQQKGIKYERKCTWVCGM